MADWIKIHRSILDSYCFATSDNFKIWTWMLLKANFKRGFVPLKIGKGFITVKVERGQFIFGRNAAEKELKIDGMKVYRVLQKYEELEQVKIEVNSQYSLVTICKYDIYQSKQEPDAQPKNNQRTTNEQSMSNGCATDEHKEEELEEEEFKEEKELYAGGKNFDFEEILNPSSFPTWRAECSALLNDDYFKQGFCKDQGLPMGNTEELMREFVRKLNLENDFKNVAGLKVHFVRHYKKHLNGKTYSAFTHSKGFIEVPDPSDYDKMQTW